MANLTYLKIVTSSVFALTLTGCASAALKVQVDVLDPEYLNEIMREDNLKNMAQKVADGRFDSTYRFLTDTKQKLEYFQNVQCYEAAKDWIDENVTILEDPARLNRIVNNAIEENRGKPLRGSAASEMSRYTDILNQEDLNAQSLIRTNYLSELSYTNSNRRLSPGLTQTLMRREQAQNYIIEQRENLFREKSADCEGQIFSTFSTDGKIKSTSRMQLNLTNHFKTFMEQSRRYVLQEAQNDTRRSILGGANSLSNQEGAFHVVKAPKYAWGAPFNYAFGKGKGGSTDIAIKVNGPADYTVKGFAFDGRATATMVRKMAVTTVGFAASAAGVPIDVKNGANGENQTIFEQTGSEDAKTAILEAEAKEKSYRNALQRMARFIIASQETIETDCGSGVVNTCTEQKKKTINQLQTIYNSQKPLIQ